MSKKPLNNNYAVTSIAFNSTGHIFIGTQGIEDIWPLTSSGAGVFRSTDNGDTWQDFNQGLPTSTRSIAHIKVAHPDRLYVALHNGGQTREGGIFTLANGETNWQRKSIIIDGKNMIDGRITPYQIFSMAIDHMGSIYASLEGVSVNVGCQLTVRSDDGGTTWQQVSVPGTNSSQFWYQHYFTSMYSAGQNSHWSNTVVAQVSGNEPAISGLYINQDNTGWSRNGDIASAFKVHFAEDMQGRVYALEDYRSNFYRTSIISAAKDKLQPLALVVHPNPASEHVIIAFDLQNSTNVSLTIADGLGRTVEQLVQETLSPKSYNYTWKAANHPSGVYFIRLQTGAHVSVKRVLITK